MTRILSIVALLSLVGCMPITPKVGIRLSPQTGEVMYSSEQETDIVIGPISASDDGQTKTLTVGSPATETQSAVPALTYGSKAVGVIDANARLIIAEAEMAKTVGPNLEAAGNLIGQILGGIASIRSAGVVLGGTTGSTICANCDASTANLQNLLNTINTAQAAVAQLVEARAAAVAASTD